MKKSLLGSFLILILILSAGHSEIASEDCDALRKENDQLKKDLQLANQEAAKQAQLALKAAEEARRQQLMAETARKRAETSELEALNQKKNAEQSMMRADMAAVEAKRQAELALTETQRARQRVQFVLDSIRKKK